MNQSPSESMSLGRVYTTWWPLALSWMLMAVELPIISAVIARLPSPEVNLAAHGGILMPLALIIESPIIMLLVASTALSKDKNYYRHLHRFMHLASFFLTGIHILLAFTPLYWVVVEGLMGIPSDVAQAGQVGLMILTPWTWSIAHRRLHQGVLIRYERSRPVSVGTGLRITSEVFVLAGGLAHGGFSGVVVGAAAMSTGVITEAVFIACQTRPVLEERVYSAPEVEKPWSYADFASFYTPLALTSMVSLSAYPLASAAISRMPSPRESLAVWPVITGLLFLVRSTGLAYKEVVVSLLEKKNSPPALARFTLLLSLTTTFLLLLVAATPLSTFWFHTLSGLRPDLTRLGESALWVGLLLPAPTVFVNYYQGYLVWGGKTRAIIEAVAIYLAVTVAGLMAAIWWQGWKGVKAGLAAFAFGLVIQVLWLWWRSGNIRKVKVSPKQGE